ncbi:hypothetical protein ABPG74_003136 [Tetrahymena malaccensis]
MFQIIIAYQEGQQLLLTERKKIIITCQKDSNYYLLRRLAAASTQLLLIKKDNNYYLLKKDSYYLQGRIIIITYQENSYLSLTQNFQVKCQQLSLLFLLQTNNKQTFQKEELNKFNTLNQSHICKLLLTQINKQIYTDLHSQLYPTFFQGDSYVYKNIFFIISLHLSDSSPCFCPPRNYQFHPFECLREIFSFKTRERSKERQRSFFTKDNKEDNKKIYCKRQRVQIVIRQQSNSNQSINQSTNTHAVLRIKGNCRREPQMWILLSVNQPNESQIRKCIHSYILLSSLKIQENELAIFGYLRSWVHSPYGSLPLSLPGFGFRTRQSREEMRISAQLIRDEERCQKASFVVCTKQLALTIYFLRFDQRY